MSLDDGLKEQLYPFLKEHIGSSVIIKRIEFLRGSMRHLDYRVIVEYATPNGTQESSHEVITLPGSDVPYVIDGKLTKAGEKYHDYLAEYGELLGDCF